MSKLERVDLDKIKVQFEQCLFIAFESIKQDKNIDYEQFKLYFSKLSKEIDTQIDNQKTIKTAITNLFNIM